MPANRSIPVHPYDPLLNIGTVIEITPNSARINLPKAATAERNRFYGYRFGFGDIGEFVVIENCEIALLGRIVLIKLPDKDRLSVEPELGKEISTHPLGSVQLLASINLKTAEIKTGIELYARLGSIVYSAHPKLMKWIAESSCSQKCNDSNVKLQIANLTEDTDTTISIIPESLFGRHCAILGSTGGGKSWSISRFIEELNKHKSKAILIDATGEFNRLSNGVKHVSIGGNLDGVEGGTDTVFPYNNLTENDLFAIFTPSGQTQAPKLRSAMKSLKLAKLEPSIFTENIVIKAQKNKAQFNTKYREHAALIDSPSADFNIGSLVQQIQEECVWITDKKDPNKWGDYNESEKSYCTTLLTRIEDIIHSPEMSCIFDVGSKNSITSIIDEFQSSEDRVLRISLKYLGFSHNVREVIANAIGRYLLSKARSGTYLTNPLIIFLDEAHQFLNKSLGDENNKYTLDAFDLIAKEGRKYSLNICISTQRPRDIPEGVLSQVGTMIVHRLTNDRDREIVEKACGDINRSVLSFLPNLVPGEAVIIGVDFPIPLTLKVRKPTYEPDSCGPNYQKHWALIHNR